jgi:His-Xaa-Ser system radical SAM maturase HxsC
MKLHAAGNACGVNKEQLLRVTTRPIANIRERADYALICRENDEIRDVSGYGACIAFNDVPPQNEKTPFITGVGNLSYLADGDVVAIHPGGMVRTLYRRNSNHNFILMTAQCNSFCLMCSQPPQMVNDSGRIREHLRLIELIDRQTEQIGITGGEPTLFKDDFLKVITHCKNLLPETSLHVLTNGRMFYYRRFAEALGEIEHPNLMLGIPLYADTDSEHDYIVQAKGAFDETVIGLHHLARYDVPVEIRVVLHRQSVPRLKQLAEFIARNFPFAAHVALMGLEMFGFVHRNYKQLWIDPHHYRAQLKEAVETLAFAGLNVSIYNHQLCLLDQDLWGYARQSISDWKNIYLPECDECAARHECGGFFQSATKKHSAYISPVKELQAETSRY